jgi:hypothetical protein
MRVDMAKVIVERPRLGSRLASKKPGYRRSLQKCALVDLPRKEPLCGRWRGRQRSLNEHLGPMRRFLRSQVGRPWNKVHQDLCEHVSFDNAVQKKHVLTHVFDFVTRHVTLIDGRPHARHRWPLREGQMYVCPQTGLLKVVAPLKRREATQYDLGSLRQFHFRDGVWWELTLRKTPPSPGTLWDIWFERPVANLKPRDLRTTYGAPFFATAKRPLSRREARALHRVKRRASC